MSLLDDSQILLDQGSVEVYKSQIMDLRKEYLKIDWVLDTLEKNMERDLPHDMFTTMKQSLPMRHSTAVARVVFAEELASSKETEASKLQFENVQLLNTCDTLYNMIGLLQHHLVNAKPETKDGIESLIRVTLGADEFDRYKKVNALLRNEHTRRSRKNPKRK